jgi:hypothetical protein
MDNKNYPNLRKLPFYLVLLITVKSTSFTMDVVGSEYAVDWLSGYASSS